ncbi:MAG: peptidyl-prolyl cis-trans isomerase [Deltaproteobacteria bacterium]|nr:peptidyl-prolyl cis-trans isomerase [Deltaproteobacteria bacterium]
MNKTAGIVLVGFVGLGVAIVVVPRSAERSDGGHGPAPAASSVTHVASASPSDAGGAATAPAPAASASAPPEFDPVLDDVPEVDPTEAAAATASGVPALKNAPKSVTFGVVLVSYAGAQSAPRNARSKADAEKLATELAELAKSDFRAAVKKGDAGSTEDAGKMYQGILEPAPEHALFSLGLDQVSGVVDTPRGFWIVRRVK